LDPVHGELRSKMPTDSSPTWLRKSGRSTSSNDSSFIRPANERVAELAIYNSESVRPYAPLMTGIALVKPLGSGGFARVLLAKDAATRRFFALKVIHKCRLLERKAETRTAQVLNEKLALASLSHPFITSLHAHYQDAKYLYLLMEVALGGDLFGLLERNGLMKETMARFYAGSLALAMEHLHLLEFVYRDLKPENVLLDAHGFVKLCDFGFAKKLKLDRTYSQCGTPDYVAPEMLNGKGVNSACDWWALGVLVFETIAGYPTFTDKGGDNMKTFANILKGEVDFPPESDCSFTTTLKALITGMLAINVTARLGYVNGGASSVITHAWFEPMDFDRLVNLSLEPPWRPTLTSATDTSHFDLEDDASNFADDAELSEDAAANWAHVWAAFGGMVSQSQSTSATAAEAATVITAPVITAPTSTS